MLWSASFAFDILLYLLLINQITPKE
jgi:hypothetical protein